MARYNRQPKPHRRAESWLELQEWLFSDSWQPGLKRFRSPFAFRGTSNLRSGLRTSLARLGGDFASMEPHLLRNFRKYAMHDGVDQQTPWDWLALAKHHGLPTRLLDWTYSPYVALHFATNDVDVFNGDSIVWAVNYHEAQHYLPDTLRRVLDAEGADVFTADMLMQVATTLDAFDALADEPFVVFFEPPSLNPRIVNQYALFSFMSSATAHMDEWLATHPELCRGIVIPAELKWEVRDKLDQANINERMLFPGLDGLSRWLKRQYTPRK
ncbi:MAG TPA: FRG domain-containing protein [Aggregatilineales bacterium]|nr:FRG domain-containing protein [Chloroflexota bacterium]HOA22384.1 FRG domain-containing protein [Aggregatilineales bacterium]HPV07499.1 FRG domain-containing protein [Aggregatilineales bacterium]HQA67898.1 FRG domain-containing protein [Aggregatilineales bacterium]HQE18895.1 FRG domain-containing protein [Aggregatilineales bacterium]